MIKQIVFRGVPHSAAMEEHANQQLEKIERFLEHENDPKFIHLFFEPSKLRQHSRVELIVKTPNYDLKTDREHEGEEFYQVLDHVIDTMYRLLHEVKQRHIDDRKQVGRHEEFKKQR